MRTVLDPIDGMAMCGACGKVYTRPEYADDCCEVPESTPPAPLLAIALSAALLVGAVFLFIVLPLLLTC